MVAESGALLQRKDLSMTTTTLNKWYDIINDGDLYPTYTRDSWQIPADGAVLCCPCFTQVNLIVPYGDGVHVRIGNITYHKDEIIGILEKLHKDNGCAWSIDGVQMIREQRINGRWQKVDT
jgi:hypothetical protein